MQKQIESIEYFACGYCENYLHHMFRHVPKQKLCFPAGVFLIRHRKFGYILYDTGYGVELKQRKLKYWLYDLGNPFYITAGQEIASQLRHRGIAPEEIQYVILSHLHPDHIGGVKSFPKAKLIVTKDLYRQFNHYRLRDLVFKELLPADFKARLWPVAPNAMDRCIGAGNGNSAITNAKKGTDKMMARMKGAFLSEGNLLLKKADEVRSRYDLCLGGGYGLKTYDLFKDGSLLIASLDGHATGQACIFLPEYRLFMAADVCWGILLLRYTSQIRKLPLLIQKNPEAYFKNIDLLRKMQKDGIKVVVSHDRPERVRRILAGLPNKSSQNQKGLQQQEEIYE
ncbi:MBL fold metallo-hydrolase [Clostridiales bacterium COT073_COT-073]|nr:MBL fold metallo-hydrolase [Clostridiales bacterium COT073_COT-073]